MMIFKIVNNGLLGCSPVVINGHYNYKSLDTFDWLYSKTSRSNRRSNTRAKCDYSAVEQRCNNGDDDNSTTNDLIALDIGNYPKESLLQPSNRRSSAVNSK